MSPYDPPSKYGFPELVYNQAVPDLVPWDTPIAELSGLSLDKRCRCGHGSYPLRLLASRVGWRRTLREIVPRLRCSKCGERPSTLALMGQSNGQEAKYGLPPPRRLDLLEGPDPIDPM